MLEHQDDVNSDMCVFSREPPLILNNENDITSDHTATTLDANTSNLYIDDD